MHQFKHIYIDFSHHWKHRTFEKQTCLKTCFIGESNIGKTSLCYAIEGKPFDPNRNTTILICDFQRRELNSGEEKIIFQLWDTAGQERFKAISQSWWKKAHL